MRLALAVALLLSAAAARAKAPFEGRIEVRLSIERQGRRTVTLLSDIFSSSAGTFVRASSETSGDKRSVLMLKAIPGYRFMIDEKKKAYRRMAEPSQPMQANPLRLVSEGMESLNGERCAKLSFVDAQGNASTVWVSRRFGRLDDLPRTSTDGAQALVDAMRVRKVDGWPVRMVIRGRVNVTWEITRVDRKPAPAKLFDLDSYEQEDDD